MTPSELLTAAADRVRDLAAQAQPGPWGSWPSPDMPGEVVVHRRNPRTDRPDPHRVATVHGLLCAEEDARWIAALSPAVAPYMERWLRRAARAWPRPDRLGASDFDALHLAKLILGEDQP